jgi:hypothetical protein
MKVLDQINETQERVLSDLETAQARLVELNERFVETTRQWLPKVEMPTIDTDVELPKGKELVASYFEFADKMLAANRAFVESLVGVWAPEAPKTVTRARAKTTTAS